MSNLDPITRPARFLRLIEVAGNLASTLDLDVLLNRIVQTAADLTGAQEASILLYDENNEELYFQAATNMDSGLMRGLIVPVEGSIAGKIVRERRAERISNVSDEPQHFGEVGEETEVKTVSLLGIPMITQDKVIGVLEAINKQNGDFTQEDQEVLSALGAQAAIAIVNARLFQQSDLIAELVHELRTPLASLNTAAHLSMRPEISEEQRMQMAETIFTETQRLSEMTTAFLDIARLESGRYQFRVEEVDLIMLLKEAVNTMHSRFEERGIEVILDLPESLPKVQGDYDKLKQVLLNLISNAIKYNRPSGTIQISIQIEDQNIKIQIRDTGHGILPEHRRELFQKFYRVPGSDQQATGTGLGLSICKRIVEAHGGEIELDSEVSVGTLVTVSLPISN